MFKFGDDGDKQLPEALNNYPYCEGHKDNRGCYIAPSCDVCEMHRSMEAEHIKETLAKLGYRKASDVAREIFEEVMQASERGVADAEGTVNRSTKRSAFREVLLHTGRMYSGHIGKAICEVFKKYESEGAKDEVSREG